MARCSFCKSIMELGTGKLFARTDGTVYHFCSSKCQKNMLKLGRDPKKTKWTKVAHKEKKEHAK